MAIDSSRIGPFRPLGGVIGAEYARRAIEMLTCMPAHTRKHSFDTLCPEGTMPIEGHEGQAINRNARFDASAILKGTEKLGYSL